MVDADEPLAEAVRRLQSDGHGVLCISGGDEEALAAADVGVGVLGDERRLRVLERRPAWAARGSRTRGACCAWWPPPAR